LKQIGNDALTGNVKRPDLESNDIAKLWQGQSTELLKQLHILTREGKLNQDSRRKLKQIYHLVQLIEPFVELAYQKLSSPQILDMGAGKSYLGFMIYDLLLRQHSEGNLIAVESRKELVQRSKEIAQMSGFSRLKFIESSIEQLTWTQTQAPALVMALHACDTATDDALYFGLKHKAECFALVPCCQAEVARLLNETPTTVVSCLWDFPLHRREFGSHLTNVIRTLTLQSLGYSVTVTELVGWEHSMKNELILAKKTGNKNPRAQKELSQLLDQIKVKPKLLRLLEANS
jgi:hypothetical protein